MAGKPMDLPPGIDIHHGTLRFRFMWEGSRRSESLPYPPTQKGIKAASQLRDKVIGLIRLGLLDQDKYAEIFPSSAAVVGGIPCFGEYAQIWLDSREIVQGTRNGYKSALNLYWMPHLALVRIDFLNTTMLRRLVSSITWTSPAVKRNALVKLSTILKSAVADGLINRNPAEPVQLPKRSKKEIDPFTLDEANLITARLYDHPHWPSRIYAAFFEFVFFTGVRLSEGLAVQWQDIDKEKKVVRIRRTIALGEVAERTKTGQERIVLLNERALQAIDYAEKYAERRRQGKGRVTETPFVFPPSKNGEFVKQTSDLHHQWRPVL